MDLSENIPSTATTGLGVDVLVATGIKRAGPGFIADVAGSVALLIALTVGCFGQGASDFTKTIDPRLRACWPIQAISAIRFNMLRHRRIAAISNRRSALTNSFASIIPGLP